MYDYIKVKPNTTTKLLEESNMTEQFMRIHTKLRRYIDNILPKDAYSKDTTLQYWYTRGDVYVFVYDTHYCCDGVDEITRFSFFLDETDGEVWSRGVEEWRVDQTDLMLVWSEIDENTPLEDVMRIHKQIWQYVVVHGCKPNTPYIYNCSLCEYAKARAKIKRANDRCRYCPLATTLGCRPYQRTGLYVDWMHAVGSNDDALAKELAEKIRDIEL